MFSAALYARVQLCLHYSHTRPRVQRASGIPCALSDWRGRKISFTTRASRREIADSCLSTSLRANGSRECAPDDRLREAIHSAAYADGWIASSLTLPYAYASGLSQAMTLIEPRLRPQSHSVHRTIHP